MGRLVAQLHNYFIVNPFVSALFALSVLYVGVQFVDRIL